MVQWSEEEGWGCRESQKSTAVWGAASPGVLGGGPPGAWEPRVHTDRRALGHEAVTVTRMPGGSGDCSVLESILETAFKKV